jgi:serine/threonine protein phosphatase PrpC
MIFLGDFMRLMIEKFGFFLMIISCFLLSFIEYYGVYFVISIPFLLALSLKNEKLFFAGFLGCFLASIMVNFLYAPSFILLAFLLGILLFFVLKNTGIPIWQISVISSIAISFIWVTMDYLFVSKEVLSILIIPLAFGLVSLGFSLLFFNSKSKDYLSVTYAELLFLISISNFILFKSGLVLFGNNLAIGFILIMIYSLGKINTVLGILSVPIFMVMCSYGDGLIFNLIIFSVLIFHIKTVSMYKKTGVILYISLTCALSAIFNNHSYIAGVLIFAMFAFTINNRVYIGLQKYVIDPKDYKIKNMKEQYEQIVKNTESVNELMQIVEEKIKENPRMRKKYGERIFRDLDFLLLKIKSEPVNNLKEKFIEELKYLGGELVGVKVKKDKHDDYRIFVEIKNLDDYNKIINCLEMVFHKRFKLSEGKYNFLTNAKTYVFINDEGYKFDYFIKQRSLDLRCGDNYMCFSTENKKYFLVSDGMGHGEKAYEDSKFALFLLRKLIELGMDASEAIKSCNALVYSKDDSYNTLDLLEYDSFQKTLILYKNGSGSSYVQYMNNVDKLTSENLPLGIVDDIAVSKIEINKNVDKIILTSDGISKNLSNTIIKNPTSSLKELVEIVFEEEKDIEDDQTIIAINVIKN